MPLFVYNTLLLLAIPLFVPFVALRILSGKESLSSYSQKLGFYPNAAGWEGCVWVHAVSVGEANAAFPLVEMLLREMPDKKILVTVSTATGMKLAVEKVRKLRAEHAERTMLAYFPLDFPFAVGSALRQFKPSIFLFLETEIWPNFLASCGKYGTLTVLVNGRLSDRSIGTYRKWKRLFKPVLSGADLLLMQTEEDAKRMKEIGGTDKNVKVVGNLKFDQPIMKTCTGEEVRNEFGIPLSSPVIIFASTHSGEDEMMLRAYQALHAERSNLIAIVAPRHPHRAPEILSIAAKLGMKVALRTKKERPQEILLLDTIGELGLLYGGTDIAVMGGSFIPHGGQNPLEPAGWKIPVVFGRHMENFRPITEPLLASGGAFMAEDETALKEILASLLSDPAKRKKSGESLYLTVLNNRGAMMRTYLEITNLIKERS